MSCYDANCGICGKKLTGIFEVQQFLRELHGYHDACIALAEYQELLGIAFAKHHYKQQNKKWGKIG